MLAFLASVAASYSTPEYIKVVQDAAVVMGALVVAATILAAIGRFLIVAPVQRYIDSRTSQIQPNANGGQSLNDLHKRVDVIEQTLASILDHLLNERNPT